MAKKEEKALEVSKQEVITKEDMERTRERRCFIPKTDIYETDQEIVLVADIPGADQKSIDITLEKNILTIEAFADLEIPEGYRLAYSEYEPGDYQRSFRLTGEVDRDKIDATVTNGQLRLKLPKSEATKLKKIPVKTG